MALVSEMDIASVGSPVRCWAHSRKHPLQPPMTPNDLLDALREDIEWPAAALRLQLNHLAPLEVACPEDPTDDGEPVVAGEAGLLPAAQRLDWRHQRRCGLAGVLAGGAAAAAPQSCPELED